MIDILINFIKKVNNKSKIIFIFIIYILLFKKNYLRKVNLLNKINFKNFKKNKISYESNFFM